MVRSALLLLLLLPTCVWATDLGMPFRIDLKADAFDRALKVGECVSLDPRVVNPTHSTVILIRPVDGSFMELRYPHYVFLIDQPIDIPFVSSDGLSGTVNPLLRRDFIKLKPGGSFSVYEQPLCFRPILAGTYRVRYQIRLNAPDEQFAPTYPYSPDKWIHRMLFRVPRVTVTSNRVILNARSNGRTADPSVHCLMGMPVAELRHLYFQNRRSDVIRQRLELPFSFPKSEVHLNTKNQVDGVRMIVLLRDNKDGLTDRLLRWAKGTNHSPVRMYPTPPFTTIDVGWYADHSRF